ncbi:E3 ubiquitin ligase PQT3-like isoform X2 [Diospyros lotus]|uniref:E3 ubiquitin ligase PQT3-like isoform X2 n=1 Tax=Diospyros lotus TaxID=55363 RepID=UPI002253A8B8|nr:E3 ubiquitin ligase PQT3-like isoform X2 [Diospyros lotus]
MSVYYKFKSAKDYDSIPIDGPFISVADLKEKIFESRHFGRGNDHDLAIANARTKEEYLDEATLIPRNSSVLVRRLPGQPCMRIVTEPIIEQDKPRMETKMSDGAQAVKTSYPRADSSGIGHPEDTEWDEFGNDLYAIPEVQPSLSSKLIRDASPPRKVEKDSKIKALVDTPALNWHRQTSDHFVTGRGFGWGMHGRGFGRGGFELKTPPQGYVCHRCKVPGHFIQHCPTNGDPNYDIKSVKPPTGIPRTMLMTTQDGSYALSSGAVAVLKPNEAAFEKKIKGLPSTRSVGNLPPEFHCPLCKQIMKDAVLTGKCCFRSFCDKCIRYHISSKSMCVCGTTNILADDIFPNLTLRETINRTLVSYNNNANGGSASQVREMDSKIPQPEMELKIPSATCDFVSMKEPAFQGSALPADEGGQQKPVCGEAGKKKKKKKAHFSVNATELEWKNSQDHAANYMMNQGHAAYDPYCSGTLAGMEGYAALYGSSLPYMGYSLGPLDIPFGIYPQDPFLEQGYMMPPVPSDRDVADFGGHLNAGPPIMTKEDFEAQKANMRRKCEIESMFSHYAPTRRKKNALTNRVIRICLSHSASK